MNTKIQERIRLIQAKIDDLVARMPAHSIPQAMILELDELEEELSKLKAELHANKGGEFSIKDVP